MTTQDTIRAALDSHDTREAARLYDAALSVAALACLFQPAVLRAVAAKLSQEAQRVEDETHTRDVLVAMAAFLTTEAEAE